MYYIPVLGALALATGTILQRSVLKRKSVGIKVYQCAEFLAITLAMIPFIYFFWQMDMQALQFKNIFIFGLVILFSITANLFTFYSMKWEEVTNLEPAKILEPLFVIILAIFFSFFIDSHLFERNLKVIIPALIAAAALIFSHVEKHHLKFNRYFIAAILGSFFFALELIISRLILDFYSPTTFYFLRCASILVISLVLFRPNFKKLGKKPRIFIFLLGLIWAVYRIVIYWGYRNLGVIFTTLVIMLGPIFIYLLAWRFLKEKINWKNIIASMVIVLCVLYATLS
jgi:drug/metabolite transporter (DMT)-like permease